jgi:hypothetical protein
MEVETTNIVLIVGVALIILERIFKCAMRVKKSKCCGGEMEMSSPTKEPSSLNTSSEESAKPVERVEEMLKRFSVENKV